MDAWVAVLVVLSFLLLGAAIFSAELLIARRRLREVRIVQCPEVRRAAAVRLAAGRAAVDAALGSAPGLAIDECTRWPRARGCDQKCLEQLQNDLDGARLSERVREWSRQATCSACGSGFVHEDARIFFVSPLGTRFQWDELPPDWLAAALEDWSALCESCGRGEAEQARSVKQ